MRYAPVTFMLLSLVLALPALSSGSDGLNVLFIYSWHEGMPWQEEIEEGFEEHFREEDGEPNLFQEYMDTGRFSSERQIEIFKTYLAEKYASESIDYVIGESGGAARLLTRHPVLFKESKVILLNPGREFEADPDAVKSVSRRITVVPVNMDTDRVVGELLSQTDARNIYIVACDTEHGKARVEEFMQSFSKVKHKRNLHLLAGLPMEQLLQQVSVLDPDSVIVYLLYFMDGGGKRYIPYNAAALISERAAVPVYSFWTSLLGSGIVGGYMLSGELVGREAADMLMHPERIEEDGLTVDLSDKFHGHFYDWRQLKRWGIKPRRLPPGSTVLYEEMSFYRHYYRELVVVIVLTVLLFIVVRNRELRAYGERIDGAHREMLDANKELGKAKQELEQMNLLLRELSVRDELTELYNRRHMDDAIRSEIVRAQRYGGDVSIIMVDIDHFKAINDRHGHHVGDEVLVNVASTLGHNIRATDTIGRWGGEEFLILCPNLNEWQARGLAEKLLAIIGETDFGLGYEVTCSFGVSAYEPGINDSQLIINADRALYEAKSSGRNCVKSQRDL